MRQPKPPGAVFPNAQPGYQPDLEAIVDVAGADGCIVADVTASNATTSALALALRRGYGAVIANKIPLVGSQVVFDTLTGSRSFRYETTVGSAVPVIEATLGLVHAADQVDVVRGVLSGTLGFISTGLQAGQPFYHVGERGDAARLHRARPALTWAGWTWPARR